MSSGTLFVTAVWLRNGTSEPWTVFLVQLFTVGGNDLLVPGKGLLLIAVSAAGAVVIEIYVDKAVALAQFTGGEGYHIDAAPGRIAHQVYAVLYRQKTSIA